MPRTSKWFISISIAILLVLPSALAQTSSRHKGRKVSKQLAVLPPAPVGPLPQVPLDQLPAAPPQVNYQNGRLSILAQNSTLADILREVRKRTGASIEIPPSATERVVASLGPAPPRDVLAALLNGTSFNYVMVGSVADPAALSSVVLTGKPASGGTQTVADVAQPSPVYTPPERTEIGPGMVRPGGFLPRVQPVTPQPANPEAANADDSADDSKDDDSDSDEAESQDQNGATPQPNAGPKTPEEIMQMLQQQQQRQQQGQPGQPPQSNPPN